MVSSLYELCLRNIHKAPVRDVMRLSRYNMPCANTIRSMAVAGELAEKSQFLNRYDRNVREDILISGSVQAGKTNELLFYCWWSIFVCKRRVVYICRNITADKIQLLDRVRQFNRQFIRDPKFYINDKLICILSNYSQIKKTIDTLKGKKYNLCVDEVDTSIKSRYKEEFRIQKFFEEIQRGALHQIGATATEFAILSTKKSLTSIFVLKNPSNYYGLRSLTKQYIDHNMETSRESVDNDIPNIKKIYPQLVAKDNFFLLHSSSSYKLVHMNTLRYLSQHYPSVTIFTYNGDAFHMKIGDGQSAPFVGDKRVKVTPEGFLRIPRTFSISEVIQGVISHPHLCCISGHLAGRGISFVSLDYKRHLTDQYYSPSNTAHGETIIQGIRLCGRYNDNPELTLWISRFNWRHIRQQYKILKNLVRSIGNESNELSSSISRLKIRIPGKRFSRPSIMKGVRLNMIDEKYMSLNIYYQENSE